MRRKLFRRHRKLTSIVVVLRTRNMVWNWLTEKTRKKTVAEKLFARTRWIRVLRHYPVRYIPDEDKMPYLSSRNYSSLGKRFEPLCNYLREPLSTIEHKEISVSLCIDCMVVLFTWTSVELCQINNDKTTRYVTPSTYRSAVPLKKSPAQRTNVMCCDFNSMYAM